MYTISICNTLMAVSETLESAMKAVPKIIMEWDGEIRYANQIVWVDGGIIINPNTLNAKGVFGINGEFKSYTITISSINKV